MTSRPRIGVLVTHRHLGKRTMYKVCRINSDATVIVTYVSGPQNHMQYHNEWLAANDNLTYAEPSLVLPVGV